jgi:benzylsuccinate CoA-transferase BbsF subunit
MAALYHRKRTGEGLYIDFSMAEGVMDMIPTQLLDYAMNGRVAEPRGNLDDVAAPHNVYRCEGEDKWVAITVLDDAQWDSFCKATGHPEWRENQRFSLASQRRKHRAELDALVTEWTKPLSAQEVTEQLQAVGVPAGPSQNNLDLSNDPQLQHRGQFIEIDHPETGQRIQMAMQGIFSAIPERRYSHSPVLDQDNYMVFHDILGLSQEEIDQLIAEEVIN